MKKTNTLRLLNLLIDSKEFKVEREPLASSYLVVYKSPEKEPTVMAVINTDENGNISGAEYFISGAINVTLEKIDMDKLLKLSGFVTNLISFTEDIK